MAHGKLKCVGSSSFLKKYYGAGYILCVTMDENSVTAEKRAAVLALIQASVPSAKFRSSSDEDAQNIKELFIILPTDDVKTSEFPKIFKDLQNNKSSLGIDTINGLSLTTMDEVFIK